MMKQINLTQKELKAKALSFLARREYSYFELVNKLKKYSESEDIIKQVLEDLRSKNFLSDRRYIEAFIRTKATRYGQTWIKSQLLTKTANKDEVTTILNQSKLNQYELALNLWKKRFGSYPTDQKTYLKQFRFLYSRGFAPEIIAKILRHIEE